MRLIPSIRLNLTVQLQIDHVMENERLLLLLKAKLGLK